MKVCWDSRDYFLKVLRIILISIIHSYTHLGLEFSDDQDKFEYEYCELYKEQI